MIFLGTVLATNASTGPCGGTALAAEPTPAIFIAILGLELILCSYFPVKNLRSESSFRAIVYLYSCDVVGQLAGSGAQPCFFRHPPW
jgi:hypothetical protein